MSECQTLTFGMRIRNTAISVVVSNRRNTSFRLGISFKLDNSSIKCNTFLIDMSLSDIMCNVSQKTGLIDIEISLGIPTLTTISVAFKP